ncbi:MAG: GNAT family N-acetyltransferase [Chloroflexota bacterium]
MSEPQAPDERRSLALVDLGDEDRYEIVLSEDGTLVALVTYRIGKGWIALLHTEVQPGFEGQGMGSRAASMVFDDARQRGLKVIPKCPFILRWLERHPEQHDVLQRPLASADDTLGSTGPLDMS